MILQSTLTKWTIFCFGREAHEVNRDHDAGAIGRDCGGKRAGDGTASEWIEVCAWKSSHEALASSVLLHYGVAKLASEAWIWWTILHAMNVSTSEELSRSI